MRPILNCPTGTRAWRPVEMRVKAGARPQHQHRLRLVQHPDARKRGVQMAARAARSSRAGSPPARRGRRGARRCPPAALARRARSASSASAALRCEMSRMKPTKIARSAPGSGLMESSTGNSAPSRRSAGSSSRRPEHRPLSGGQEVRQAPAVRLAQPLRNDPQPPDPSPSTSSRRPAENPLRGRSSNHDAALRIHEQHAIDRRIDDRRGRAPRWPRIRPRPGGAPVMSRSMPGSRRACPAPSRSTRPRASTQRSTPSSPRTRYSTS